MLSAMGKTTDACLPGRGDQQYAVQAGDGYAFGDRRTGVRIPYGNDHDPDGSDSHFPECVAGAHAHNLCVPDAKLKRIDSERITKELDSNKIVVVTGFQGVNKYDDVTTLGRGGSDTTAVALAAALNADLCEIYTDVDGVYTADPRIVPDARKMPEVTYEEMLEFASLGAKCCTAAVWRWQGGTM